MNRLTKPHPFLHVHTGHTTPTTAASTTERLSQHANRRDKTQLLFTLVYKRPQPHLETRVTTWKRWIDTKNMCPSETRIWPSRQKWVTLLLVHFMGTHSHFPKGGAIGPISILAFQRNEFIQSFQHQNSTLVTHTYNPLTLCGNVPALVHVHVWVHIPGDPQSVQLRNATTTTTTTTSTHTYSL